MLCLLLLWRPALPYAEGMYALHLLFQGTIDLQIVAQLMRHEHTFWQAVQTDCEFAML